MKRNKVESILLIAVLALSIQTGSYSAAISIGYGMERSRKGGGM